MARPSKRSLNVIDLTGSSDEEQQPQQRRQKVPRHRAATVVLHNEPHPSRSGPPPNAVGNRDEADDDDDESNGNLLVADMTQSTDDCSIGFVQVGAIDGIIVGIRYYNGYASVGETVLVRRDPQNQYDSNAIRIDNVQGAQIGHIPRKVAAKLAPYMDDRSLLVEGVLTGEKGSFDCPIQLNLYGTSEPLARQELEARMKNDKLPLKKKPKERGKKAEEIEGPVRKKLGYTGSQSTGGLDQPDEEVGVSIDQLVSGSERLRPRELGELVEQWGSPEDMLVNMPAAEQPRRMKAQLLPYQLQGLAWMLGMENPQPPTLGSQNVVQLWKRHPQHAGFFINIATNFSTKVLPPLVSGGILADDMGLGKTVQVISTIVQGGPGTTLIVAPVSVMSNWTQQVQRHVDPSNPLRVLTFHGSNRKHMSPGDFAKYDVVITSYGTLSSEYLSLNAAGIKTGMFSMKWRRLVLDEGHIIRNPRTRAAVAACNINAQSHWVLTGTPIVNTIKDLYSMLKFLKITGGLEQLEVFNSVLARPLNAGDQDADLLLQTIMRSMCLRRKKEMKFVDLRLPELSEYVHRIPFRQDEREKYSALQMEAKGMLHKYQEQSKQGKGIDTYRHLFELLLRLRQVCCHWKLCGNRVTNLLAILDAQKVLELNDENRLALQAYLQVAVENSDECPICLETLHNPVITACKHAFGLECIERTIAEQHKCPMCRAPIKDQEELVKPAVAAAKLEEDEAIDVDTQSSKTEALMKILKASRRDPRSKVVIFSQWTSFLNIIQHQLDAAGYRYVRIDGTMSAAARDGAMAALDTDSETRILLASLAVCSVGLNLVAADTVILADSWWAPAVEDQAVDRVHRLGQTRPTTVWRLIMEDSIEERVLEIQKEKRRLVGKAFREKGKATQTKTTRMADLQLLLR